MGDDDVSVEVTEEREPQVSQLMISSIVLGFMGNFFFVGLVSGNPPVWLALGVLLIGPLIGIAAIAQILSSRGRVKGPMSVWAFLGAWLLLLAMPASYYLLLRGTPAHPPPQ